MRQPSQGQQPSGPRRWFGYLFYAIAFGLLGLWMFGNDNNKGVNKDLSYTKLTAYIEADHASRRMDPYDPYWDDPLGEYMKWITATTMDITTVKVKHPPQVQDWQMTEKGTTAAGMNGSGTFGKTSRSSSKKDKSKGRSKIRIREE